MLKQKKKIITSTKRSAPALYYILTAFSLCMSVMSVLFLFTIFLFLITGEENIYLHKSLPSLFC